MNEDNEIGQEDLASVLTEFHKRVMAEPNQSTGVPAPFNITSTVQSLHPMQFQEPKTKEERLIVPKTKGVKFETDYYFGQYNVNNLPQHYFTLGLQINGATNDAVQDEVAIIPLMGLWEHSVAPVQSGKLGFSFNQSSWLPPGPGQPPVVAMVTVNYLGIQIGVGLTISVALRMQFALRHVAAPQEYAKYIYIAGVQQNLWHADNSGAVPFIDGAWSWYA